MDATFEIDLTRIRDQARSYMAAGPVIADDNASRLRLIEVLNEVVASEVVCFLRYSQHAITATGLDSSQVAAEFREHATQEMNHGLLAAERVSQLGGEPDFDPATLVKRSHTEYVTAPATDLRQMLTENLIAERIAIATYSEIIRWIGDSDPTTRRMMETILAEEEEHADDLNDLLGN
jgi:bacterioferritin